MTPHFPSIILFIISSACSISPNAVDFLQIMKEIITTHLLFLFLLLSQQVRAQVQPSAPPGLEPSSDSPTSQNFRRPTEVIVVAVLSILLFVAFYFIYLCCCIDDHLLGIRNWTNWRRPWDAFSRSSRRRHLPKWFPFELDPNVVKSFPKFEYEAVKSLMIGKGNLECAVCLMEFNDKDVLRLIPRCNHVFHAHCVDDWLVSHATCPVCRLNLTSADMWVHNDAVLDEDNEGNMMLLSSRSLRTRTRSFSSLSGQPRWLGRLSRSLSTGHMSVKQWDDMDRFTLRLPWEVRKMIISGEGRSKSERFGNNNAKVDQGGKSDSWIYSLAPSFRKQYKLETVSRTSTRLEESSTSVVPIELTQLPV